MRLTCPSCHAEASLEVLLSREADARALAAFIERHLGFGEQLLRYVALFRPPKRRLGIARMLALVGEVLPDIERAAITRKGRDWHAPREAWQAAIDTIVSKRDKGTLTLPLTGHGLLYEVLCSHAEKTEAQAEARREQDRRDRRTPGVREPGPRNLADMALDVASGPMPLEGCPALPAVAAPAYSGPSRAALAIQAANLARRAAAAQSPAASPQEQQP